MKITRNTLELKKVSEDFIKQFREIAIPPPNIILNYMSKKAKFENN